jgi:DNA-binding XRE family transcriptional regulator
MEDTKLTPAEQMVITRRRFGLSQQCMADALNTSLYRIQQVESGNCAPPSDFKPDSDPLSGAERAFIMRRRSGKTQSFVAKDLGICRYWVNLMELGKKPCDELLWYWEQ